MKITVNEAAPTAVKALDRLVGVWNISGSGGISGNATFEWIEGGFFLMQRGVMEKDMNTRRFRSLEVRKRMEQIVTSLPELSQVLAKWRYIHMN